jgi:hypothetical protein
LKGFQGALRALLNLYQGSFKARLVALDVLENAKNKGASTKVPHRSTYDADSQA